jgi:hypothetical protein
MPASQEVGYGPYNGKHLHIKVEPVEKKDFYFTDEKPVFLLRVENIGNEQFDDDLQWFLESPGGRRTLGSVPVKLEPGEKRQYSVGERLLGFPGTLALCLTIPPKLPMRDLGIDVVLPRFHTLYTFEAYDRALYKTEQREKRILRASVIVASLTLIAVIIFGLIT